MNTTHSMTQDERLCCQEQCTDIITTPGDAIINAYKCEQKKFSAGDYWNVRRRRFSPGNSPVLVVRG